ncbi:MAG TPA: ABC-F family ATP-binding cassette domain-containing protein [Gemmatimonadaceae bacterium]
MTQIAVGGVAVEFGATTVFEDITFTVAARDRWGIVGRNGTGKTTLFSLLTGERKPTRGNVVIQPGVRVSLLEQHREFGDGTTIWEAAAGPFADLMALEASLAEQAAALAHDASDAALERFARDQERFEHEGGYTFTPRVDAVLQGLGFDPDQARVRHIGELSGGERGRVGLARQLVTDAEVLLLDEPTNHLDLETTRWLELYLKSSDRTVLVVSHDRAFLAAIADHILHFEGGTATPYNAGYEDFVHQRAERRLAQARAFEKQQRVIASEQDYIARNLAGQNSSQAKGRRKRLERMERLSGPTGEAGAMALRLEAASRGGDQVVVTDRLQVDVPGRVLLRDFTTVLPRGARVGLVGPNGAGKSTLLRTIVGDLPPARGGARLGSGITVAYYRQDMAQVPLDQPLYQIIADLRPMWERRMVQGHLGRFGFSGDEAQRIAGTLSGGERSRVALAMLMLTHANLLVLDEPTNHLDVESIEALEDALTEYEGTVLLVSHDRALLRGIVDGVWVLHEQEITEFDGSFAEWEAVSEERRRAAEVAASEAEALRRVHEKQKLQSRQAAAPKGRDRDDGRKELRKVSRQLEEVEQRIATLEARVGALTTTLGDPSLYGTPEGVERAHRASADLEEGRRALDAALEEWTALTERVEALTP